MGGVGMSERIEDGVTRNVSDIAVINAGDLSAVRSKVGLDEDGGVSPDPAGGSSSSSFIESPCSSSCLLLCSPVVAEVSIPILEAILPLKNLILEGFNFSPLNTSLTLTP